MKKLSEVLEALTQRWDAPLKEIQGFSYVPWEETAYHLSEVFGPMGWSDHTTPPHLDEKTVLVNKGDRDNPNYQPVNFQGYSCVVEIEVQVYDDLNDTGILRITRSGPGFGAIIAQGDKNPLDTAEKAAGSDGLSKAAKKFGDAFALYLYREKKKPSSYSNSGTTGQQAGGATRYPASEAQKSALINRFKLSAEMVNSLSKTQASAIMKGIIEQQLSAEEAVKAAGATWVEPAAKKDDLPIPAGRR